MIIERTDKSSNRTFVNGGFVVGIIVAVIVMTALVWTYSESGDARFCGSCHSMKTVRDGWQASHHAQFTCTECHLPDTHIAAKVFYMTRAGFNDLVCEAVRFYPASIGLSPEGRRIINANCIRCHASTIARTQMTPGGNDCLHCHRFLVHGREKDEGGIKLEK